jgi:putative intracellular protease/amidase
VIHQNQTAQQQPLAGKRVAVIVESQFIPQELDIYRRRFESYGATVDFVSHLWGHPTLRFYSTVEPGVVDQLQYLDVSIEIDNIKPSDYAAIIAAANYTTVRLRSVTPPPPGVDPRGQVRKAPAVRFFRDAMADRRIVKGAACHALWLLTPSPEVLRGRRVVCNTVVLADVLNAGATYVPFPPDTPEPEQVLRDDDLVTNTSWHAAKLLVDTIKDIIAKSNPAAPPTPAEVTP